MDQLAVNSIWQSVSNSLFPSFPEEPLIFIVIKLVLNDVLSFVSNLSKGTKGDFSPKNGLLRRVGRSYAASDSPRGREGEAHIQD